MPYPYNLALLFSLNLDWYTIQPSQIIFEPAARGHDLDISLNYFIVPRALLETSRCPMVLADG